MNLFSFQKKTKQITCQASVPDFLDKDTPYTRIVEHKHFEQFGESVYNNPKTVITREYPIEYQPGLFEPYYPVNDEKNNRLCSKYQKLANMEKNVLFGGRLADYKYYNMDEVIEKSLSLRFS